MKKPCKQWGQLVHVLGHLPGWHRGPAPGMSERGRGVGGRPAGGQGQPHTEASGFYSQSLVWFLVGRSEAEEWRDWVGVIKSSLRRMEVQGPWHGWDLLPSMVWEHRPGTGSPEMPVILEFPWVGWLKGQAGQ